MNKVYLIDFSVGFGHMSQSSADGACIIETKPLLDSPIVEIITLRACQKWNLCLTEKTNLSCTPA